MDPSVYYCIISFFIISTISFNSALFTTDTTLSSETDNEPEKLSSDREIQSTKTNVKLHTSRRLTVQNFILIWLDSNIDVSDNDYRKSMTRLREIVNKIYTFTDANQCVDFLNQIKGEKVFLILSDDLLQSTVSLIHGMSQLDSIYVFSGNESKYDQWTKQWTKIKGVFTQIDPILDALKLDAQQCDRDSLSFSITDGHLDRLDPMFMYTCLLKKTLIEIKHDNNAKKELVDFCRKQYCNNSYELQKMNAFERDYRLDTAIWWYAQKCFLYQMLNRALRTQEIEIIMKMGFFLRDVHRQIKELHSQKARNGSLFMVYRGQGISNTDFERIKRASKGDLLAFNNFLSASLNKKVALQFARNSLHDPDLVGILFNMTITTSISSNPFVSRRQVDAFANEKEGILFSIYTVFRITDIKPIENRLWQVELTLMRDDDQQLIQLLERMRKETSKSRGWQRLGDLLMRMRNFDKAEESYQILLHKTSEVDEKALPHLYNQLGRIKHKKEDYMEALEFYRKALEIQQKSLPSNHRDFTTTYNNIASVHSNMNEYSKALSFYEKALKIYQKSFPQDHPYLATIYHNIGSMHKDMGEYSKALEYFQKALEIREKSRPSTHPDMATIYSSMGLMHLKMEQYSKALEFYQKALETQQKSLSPDDPTLAITYHNIASTHYSIEEYSKALEFFKKILEIQEKSLLSNHSDLSTTYNNIGSAYVKLSEYPTALEFFQKTLEIQQKSLSPNDVSLITTHNNIGSMYTHMGKDSKALEFYQKSVEIGQKSLPPNHPDMAAMYYYIGSVYHHMKEDSIALSFFERAVEIGQLSLPENHSNLELYRKHLYELQHEL